MENLVGKKVLGFRFTGDPTFVPLMEIFIGKEGEIIRHYSNGSCGVKFEDTSRVWSYPYPETLNHLVDPPMEIDEIISKMKQLNSELWKTKI